VRTNCTSRVRGLVLKTDQEEQWLSPTAPTEPTFAHARASPARGRQPGRHIRRRQVLFFFSKKVGAVGAVGEGTELADRQMCTNFDFCVV
jgi:hypothetical protein